MKYIDFVLETPWVGCEARETFEFEDDVEEVEIEKELNWWIQERLADFNGYWEEA